MIETLKLADATRKLKIPYQRLYQNIVAGNVPAERDASGNRWLIRKSDLRVIEEILGIEYGNPKTNTRTPKPVRKSGGPQ